MWHTDLKLAFYDLIHDQLFLVKEKRMYKTWVTESTEGNKPSGDVYSNIQASTCGWCCRADVAVLKTNVQLRVSRCGSNDCRESKLIHFPLRRKYTLPYGMCWGVAYYGSPHQCHPGRLYLRRMVANPVAPSNIYWIFRFTGLYKCPSSDSYSNGFNWPKASTRIKYHF